MHLAMSSICMILPHQVNAIKHVTQLYTIFFRLLPKSFLSDNALERVLRIVRAMHDARMLNGVLTKPARKAYLHIGRIVETLCSMCDATKDCLADIRTERG